MADRTSLLADQVAPPRKKKQTQFTQILRVFNIILALAIVGFAIYCYIGYKDSTNVPPFFNDPSMTVLPAYVALAGLIILAVELNIRVIVRNMKFLYHYLGRGVFNIYVGVLCFAMIREGTSDTYKIVVYVAGGLVAFFGVMYIFAAVFCCASAARDYEEDQNEKNRSSSQAVIHTNRNSLIQDD